LLSTQTSEGVSEGEGKLPFPEIGDVVTFAGKWPGEAAVGRIATLQYIAPRSEWIADVVVFKDIEPGLFREEKRMRNSEYLPVLSLKPVTASYVQSSDGWRVPLAAASDGGDGKKKGAVVVLTSASGFDCGPDFALPIKEVNALKAAQYEQNYDKLKERLLKETLLFGAAGTVAAIAFTGPTIGLTFGVGVLSGAAYLLLLERNTDQVGNEGSTRGDLLSSLRFAVPILLLGGISLERWVFGAHDQFLFSLMPQDQFLAAVGGFLSYRIPLLFTEIKNGLSGGLQDQLGELLPGSIGKSVALANSYRRANDDMSGVLDSEICRVLLVSGPKGTGRSELVNRLMLNVKDGGADGASASGGAGSASKQTAKLSLTAPPVATTRPPRVGEAEQGAFTFLDRLSFERQQREGGVIATFDDDKRGGGGGAGSGDGGFKEEGELFGLRLADVLNAGSNGRVCVIDAPSTAFADKIALALEQRADVRLAGAWVSLNTLEDFEARLEESALPAADNANSQEEEEEEEEEGEKGSGGAGGGEQAMRDSLKGVISDIEWGVLSGLFEFTVINDDPARALAELRQAAFFLARDGEFEVAEEISAARPPGV